MEAGRKHLGLDEERLSDDARSIPSAWGIRLAGNAPRSRGRTESIEGRQTALRWHHFSLPG